MSSQWKPYRVYQALDLEWIGEIPEGWRTIRLKRAVKGCQNGIWGDAPDGEDDVICVRVADFDRVKHRVVNDELTIRSVPKDKREGQLLQVGDLLLEKSGGGEKQPVGAVVRFDLDLEMPAVCSNFIARMPVASGLDSRFLNYLHTALYAMGVNIRSIKQSIGIQNLDSDHYLMQRVPIPSLYEQRAIAAFLDRETSKIDTLIRKQERLIELLEEKRAALISHAVTKGLDPGVPMKDSDVPWLREIPKHWEARRVKFIVAEMRAGPFGSSLTKSMYTHEGYRVYGQEQVIPADFSIGDYYISPEKYDAMQQYAVSSGDVLISCVGTFGKAAIVPDDAEPGIINPRLIKLSPIKSIVAPEYLCAFLASAAAFGQMEQVSRGGTMDVINMGLLSDLWIPLPPVKEQRLILHRVDYEASKIETLIDHVQNMIKRLQEYRTALISAAVTGKIDVRQQVPPA